MPGHRYAYGTSGTTFLLLEEVPMPSILPDREPGKVYAFNKGIDVSGAVVPVPDS